MRKRPSPLAIKERIDFNLSVKLLNVLKSVGIALFLITVIGVGLDQLITVKPAEGKVAPFSLHARPRRRLQERGAWLLLNKRQVFGD